jgi:uncharacterized protein YktB (UPF0637 family)
MTTMSNETFTIDDMRTLIVEYLDKNNMTLHNDPKPLLAVIGENKIE